MKRCESMEWGVRKEKNSGKSYADQSVTHIPSLLLDHLTDAPCKFILIWVKKALDGLPNQPVQEKLVSVPCQQQGGEADHHSCYAQRSVFGNVQVQSLKVSWSSMSPIEWWRFKVRDENQMRSLFKRLRSWRYKEVKSRESNYNIMLFKVHKNMKWVKQNLWGIKSVYKYESLEVLRLCLHLPQNGTWATTWSA